MLANYLFARNCKMKRNDFIHKGHPVEDSYMMTSDVGIIFKHLKVMGRHDCGHSPFG